MAKYAEFYIYETKHIPLKFKREGILANLKTVIVSINQLDVQINKNQDEVSVDVDNNIIHVYLSQEETGKFQPDRSGKMQVNLYYEDEERDVSVEIDVKVYDNLYKKVIGNE